VTLSRKIANYELGIVFPMKDVAEADKVACWQRPPRKYTTEDEPWVNRPPSFSHSIHPYEAIFFADAGGIYVSPIMSKLLIRMKLLCFKVVAILPRITTHFFFFNYPLQGTIAQLSGAGEKSDEECNPYFLHQADGFDCPF
jgi:hypothetical protein